MPGRTRNPSGAHRPVRGSDRCVPGGAGAFERHRRLGKDPDMIVELRRYTLREGRRDELIDLFDREFVETQEELGMAVLGQFRDLDRPDRFVWLRGFTDMQSRRAALETFYGGPGWQAQRGAAKAALGGSH